MIDLDEILHRLDSWSEAYPESVFPEPTDEQIAAVNAAYPSAVTRISAQMGRHMVKHMREMADAVREQQAQHERIVAGLEADARRYRWLRDEAIMQGRPDVMGKMVWCVAGEDAFNCHPIDDAELDAFLAQTEE